jgi:hypothetical protein
LIAVFLKVHVSFVCGRKWHSRGGKGYPKMECRSSFGG